MWDSCLYVKLRVLCQNNKIEINSISLSVLYDFRSRLTLFSDFGLHDSITLN